MKAVIYSLALLGFLNVIGILFVAIYLYCASRKKGK